MLINVDDLTPQQSQAIAALVGGKSQREAADEVGVNQNTLSRWMSQRAFIEAYRKAQGELMTGILLSLRHSALRAIGTLQSVMDCEDVAPAARVSAAKAILDNLIRATDQLELAQRLEALEAVFSAKEKH